MGGRRRRIRGWSGPVFRWRYVRGALLGGAPLAQGTVHLFFSKRTAERMAIATSVYVVAAAVCGLLSPVDTGLVEESGLSGKVPAWS